MHVFRSSSPASIPGRARRPLLSALVFLAAAALPAAPLPAEKLAAMDAAVTEAIAAKKTPGGVLWFEHAGTVYQQAYGQRALVPAPEAATLDTIYDAASLTKVVATTTAVLQLVERGRLELDAPVVRYVPDFAQHGKGEVTVRQLMTHTSGLRPDLDYKPVWSGAETALRMACAEKPRSLPGSTFVYSDIGFIVLGELVRLTSGRRLDEYAAQEIFGPLKMTDTGFLPSAARQARIAPTELTEGQMLRGVVHDPSARMMGGVAGHAGLFTTAADLARFCRMLLGGGQLDGVRILSAVTVAEMTRVQIDGSDRRGLGWDIDSRFSGPRGRWFPAGATFGHTGFTGTTMWIDPGTQTFLILLSNRVHPDGKGDIGPVRRALGTLAAEAVGRDAGAVLNGIDALVRQEFAPLRGLRVGLITNQTGRDREGRATIDLVHGAKDVKLVALFSPEHGIRGTADAKVSDSVDEKTKLPIYSLYGEMPKRADGQSAEDFAQAVIRAHGPKPEHLRDLDALVFDLQDIGARYYTYAATLGASLEIAGREKKKFFVLDRVNPINGRRAEGPVLTRTDSVVGYHAVPIRHGMTLGELARMYNVERGFGAELVVIPCERWTRDQWLDQTGLPWVNPSPSMRSLTAATLYPGLCLLEGVELSMGRGTLKPFEQVGAPFVDGERLAAELNRAGLAGARFEPVRFTPQPELYPGPAATLKLNGQACGGVRVVITDRDQLDAVDLGLELALVLQRWYPEQIKIDRMAKLLGDDATLAAIKAGQTRAQIKAGWAERLAAFEARRAKFLLYATAPGR